MRLLIPFGRRLPRVRLRTLLIAVAVAALPLATWARIEARRVQFRSIAAQHRKKIIGLVCYRGGWNIFPVAIIKGEYRILRESEVKLDTWHLRLSEKYARAAESPWMPVAPDPDPPGR